MRHEENETFPGEGCGFIETGLPGQGDVGTVVNVIILHIKTWFEGTALVPQHLLICTFNKALSSPFTSSLISVTPTSRLLRGDSPPCRYVEQGSASGHGLARPSNTVLPPIKIQRTGRGSAAPPSSTFLTSSWTPRVCTFIGSAGQMDKVFGIIYPDVLLPDPPTCPHPSPRLGSCGPCKTQPLEEMDIGLE